MAEYSHIERSNLIEQLERHLEWIKSCDTKSSIVLAVVGIFLTVFTSEHSINMLNNILTTSVENITFSNLLYLLLFALFWCIFIYGSYCLVRVLIPRLSEEALTFEGVYPDSLFFFENIAKNTFSEYKEKVINRNKDDEITDILSQIFVNAQICTAKYSYYRKGIKFTFVGISGVFVLYIVGVILVKAGGF